MFTSYFDALFRTKDRVGCLPDLENLENHAISNKFEKGNIFYISFVLIEVYEHVFLFQKTQNNSNLKVLYEM